MKQIERKVELEQDSRIKNEDEIRKFMETKFYHLSEQHKQDEKMVLEREKRIMNQVQEGLVTMNEIIKGTKEQNLISLSH